MSATRHPEAQVRLTAWAQARLGAVFRYGVTDCAILAFEAFDALTGAELAAGYRARWANRFGALRFQARHGTDSARVLLGAGCLEVSLPAALDRGDFLVVWKDGFACAHIAFGVRALSSTPEAGVAWLSSAEILAQPGVRLLRVPWPAGAAERVERLERLIVQLGGQPRPRR